MVIEFVEVEIALTAGMSLVTVIETALRAHGEPLRWAIASVDPAAQIAHVEAVVTVAGPT